MTKPYRPAALLLALALFLSGCTQPPAPASSSPSSSGTLPSEALSSETAPSTGFAQTSGGTAGLTSAGAASAQKTSRNSQTVTTKATRDSDKPKTTQGHQQTTAAPTTRTTSSKTASPTTLSKKETTMYVQKQDDKIQTVFKYSPTQDFVMVLEKRGPNKIFNVGTPRAIANKQPKVSSNLDSAGYLYANLGVSDWFGPHVVNALSNADGDRKWGEFTGGSHSYLNNESSGSSATGRTDSIRLMVDGKQYDSFSGYAERLDIYWDNYIQAANTKKKDGSGREVLIEHYHMSFDGRVWNVECDIEFLENVMWSRYYGMQCVYADWNQSIRYGGEDWIPLDSDTDAPDKMCDTMVLKRGNHYLEMYMDNSYGLGDRAYVSNNLPGAFSRDYGNGKAYFQLVNGMEKRMEAGTTVSYRGYYRFYYA